MLFYRIHLLASEGEQRRFSYVTPHVRGCGERNRRFTLVKWLIKYELLFVRHQNTLSKSKREVENQNHHLYLITL